MTVKLRPNVALGLFSLSAALLWQAPAQAHLGGDASSVDSDRQVMHAQLRTVPMQQYSVHEITTESGGQVREYATPQGTVFAVTWRGPLPPDLQQLFGGYYQQYHNAVVAHARPGMHRQLQVAAADLVVQATARPRSFGGKAYVPSLMPAGVSIADLQ
ncbi:MAG: DUF2844 domain-containing protein [Steroidobacteraceae bacterium]